MLMANQVAVAPPDRQRKPKAYNDSFRKKIPGLTKTLGADSSLSDAFSESPSKLTKGLRTNASQKRFINDSTRSLTKDASWVKLEDLREDSFSVGPMEESKHPSINNLRSPSIN